MTTDRSLVATDGGSPSPEVHLTAGLLDTLLEMAAEADPQSVTVRLAVTPANELDTEDELSADTPVFTDLYLPTSGRSIEAVFGVDVSVPPGQTPGVFISHPRGPLDLATTDDLAQRILIAVPPWTRESVAAFDRGGRERPLRIHEGELADAYLDTDERASE